MPRNGTPRQTPCSAEAFPGRYGRFAARAGSGPTANSPSVVARLKEAGGKAGDNSGRRIGPEVDGGACGLAGDDQKLVAFGRQVQEAVRQRGRPVAADGDDQASGPRQRRLGPGRVGELPADAQPAAGVCRAGVASGGASPGIRSEKWSAAARAGMEAGLRSLSLPDGGRVHQGDRQAGRFAGPCDLQGPERFDRRPAAGPAGRRSEPARRASCRTKRRISCSARLFADAPLPRWADEGMAVLAEPPARIDRFNRTLHTNRRQGRLVPLERLLAKNEYPDAAMITVFYVESVSVVDFLVAEKGPQEFVQFVRDAAKSGLESALQKHYDCRSGRHPPGPLADEDVRRSRRPWRRRPRRAVTSGRVAAAAIFHFLPTPADARRLLGALRVSTSPTPAASRLTLTAWLIVIIAAIGFAFDTYELLMARWYSGRRSAELSVIPPSDPGFPAAVGLWQPLMFYVPAVAGGIFGLIGGYLTDRLGRRRVLTWSILLYSVSAFLAGLLDVVADAAGVSVYHVHRRVRGIRGRHLLACGTIPRAASARAGTRLHAGVLVVRRAYGCHREFSLDREHAKTASLPSLFRTQSPDSGEPFCRNISTSRGGTR